MIALIDADIVSFRCAAINEGEDLSLALYACDTLLERILKDVNASSHKLYLTGSQNFRKEIYPEYKAHRKTKTMPRHWTPLKEHMLKHWNADMTHGYEADDALGMEMTKFYNEVSEDMGNNAPVICSIDKDLKQVPGTHYNFVKQELTNVSEEEANYNFWYQMLVGDAADNIKGVPGVGPKTAEPLLKYNNPEDYPKLVLNEYRRTSGQGMYEITGKLLWIWRKKDDIWKPILPAEQEPEVQSKS